MPWGTLAPTIIIDKKSARDEVMGLIVLNEWSSHLRKEIDGGRKSA